MSDQGIAVCSTASIPSLLRHNPVQDQQYRKISFLAALARYRPPSYTGRGQLELETTVKTSDNGPLAVAADVSGIGESWRAHRCKN